MLPLFIAGVLEDTAQSVDVEIALACFLGLDFEAAKCVVACYLVVDSVVYNGTDIAEVYGVGVNSGCLREKILEVLQPRNLDVLEFDFAEFFFSEPSYKAIARGGIDVVSATRLSGCEAVKLL